MSTALAAAAASFELALRGLGLTGDEPELGDAAEFGQWAALSAATGALWYARGIAADDSEPPCAHCGPAGAFWHVRFGPLLDMRHAQSLLGLDSQAAVADLIRRKDLLALTSHGGLILIPLFQFGNDGRPLPAVPPVLQALAEVEMTDWKVATWLFASNAELAGQAPIAWIKAGGNLAPVVAATRGAPAARAAAQAARAAEVARS